MIKLSIIVPVYNVELYLRRCIDSILTQTYENYELILVNDGSNDSSGRICDEYLKIDKRIKVIHKLNGGLSSARNAGLDIAKGDYIGFVDSDDWITKDMFQHLVELITVYNCEIASSSYILSNVDTHLKEDDIKINVYNKRDALIHYLETGMSSRISDYPVWTKLYKKELFEEIRFPEGKLYEDVATNFSLIQKVNTYVKSSKICYYYYQDGSSITRGGFRLKDMDIFFMGNQLVNFAKEENDKLILNLAKSKEARSSLSLLAKIAMYGFRENIDCKQEIVDKLTSDLRKNYWVLIKSKMKLSRKILMTFLCINMNLTKKIINIIKPVVI